MKNSYLKVLSKISKKSKMFFQKSAKLQKYAVPLYLRKVKQKTSLSTMQRKTFCFLFGYYNK